jgi:hypothetical protein
VPGKPPEEAEIFWVVDVAATNAYNRSHITKEVLFVEAEPDEPGAFPKHEAPLVARDWLRRHGMQNPDRPLRMNRLGAMTSIDDLAQQVYSNRTGDQSPSSAWQLHAAGTGSWTLDEAFSG